MKFRKIKLLVLLLGYILYSLVTNFLVSDNMEICQHAIVRILHYLL